MAWLYAPQKRYHTWSPNEQRASLGAWCAFYIWSRSVWKKKIFDKLGSWKKTLNKWSQRDLSIVGRINIIKTLALKKLVLICSVMNTTKDLSKEINKITFDFIGNHTPAKIKKSTLWSKVLSQPIWNNWFLTVNKKMVFFHHWYQAGIEQISDLSYSCEGHFLPFNSFCNKFKVKCNFLQYYSILSSIPQNWKKVLQEGSKDPVTPPTSICSLSCKTIYSMQLNL